jgi:hypothetical protein
LKKKRGRSAIKVVVSHTVEQEIRENYNDRSQTRHICLCKSYLSTHSAAFSGFQVMAIFLAGKLYFNYFLLKFLLYQGTDVQVLVQNIFLNDLELASKKCTEMVVLSANIQTISAGLASSLVSVPH